MARTIQRLLQAAEPHYSMGIVSLEKASGHKGTDLRLMANILERAHHVMRELGLDTRDTTPIELYKALNAHASKTSLFSDTSYVGLVFGKEVISFNKLDIKANTKHTFEMRTSEHLRRALERELVRRYREVLPSYDTRHHSIESLLGIHHSPDKKITLPKHKNIKKERKQ